MDKVTRVVILNENTRAGNDTGAGIMRNRCAFTSRDQGEDWASAFTYAIVFGWHDDDGIDEDATPEIAARFDWDDDLVAFLRDAHERFKALPDKKEARS